MKFVLQIVVAKIDVTLFESGDELEEALHGYIYEKRLHLVKNNYSARAISHSVMTT